MLILLQERNVQLKKIVFIVFTFSLLSVRTLAYEPILHASQTHENESASNTTKDEVLNILIDQLEKYLDTSYDVKGTGITYKKSVKKMMKEMHSIVIDTLNPYKKYVRKGFDGFSDEIRDKLEFLGKVNWNSAKTGAVFVDPSKIGQDYIRSRLSELKEQIKSEVIIYSHMHLDEFGDIDTSSKLPEDTATTFVPNQSLIAIDDKLEFMPISDSFLEISNVDFISKPRDKTSVSSNNDSSIILNNDLAERMLDLMASNNQLIEKISEEMALMRVTMEEMRREGEERDKAMYNDLNNKYLSLKDAIVDLQKEGSLDLNFANTRPIASKENVEIKFGYGSVSLSATNTAKLNGVFSDLLRNASYKVIVTGFADSSGNREQNIVLSQKRANAVKYHLTKMGISTKRIVVNYLGDIGSENYDPDDRKVVLEWLEEVDLGRSIFPE